jgi:hypothetical protein
MHPVQKEAATPGYQPEGSKNDAQNGNREIW